MNIEGITVVSPMWGERKITDRMVNDIKDIDQLYDKSIDQNETDAIIEEETRRIEEMTDRKNRIVGYHNDVKKMLDWRI